MFRPTFITNNAGHFTLLDGLFKQLLLILITFACIVSSPLSERLVKAKSDGSLSVSSTDNSAVMSRLKSKSLEPLTGNFDRCAFAFFAWFEFVCELQYAACRLMNKTPN